VVPWSARYEGEGFEIIECLYEPGSQQAGIGEVGAFNNVQFSTKV
jgi:hypothetical protein